MKTYTRSEMEREMPSIRAMKSVEDAFISREGYLIVQTSPNLRHRKSILPLAQVNMLFSPNGQQVALRYAHPFYGLVHWHPTIATRIGLDVWRRGCIGGYEGDLYEAHRRSMQDEVILALAMLQGIRSESLSSDERFAIGMIWLFGLGLLLCAYMVITTGS